MSIVPKDFKAKQILDEALKDAYAVGAGDALKLPSEKYPDYPDVDEVFEQIQEALA